MKNKDKWKPSKFVLENGSFVASRDPTEVWPPSRLMANLVAKEYQEYLAVYAGGNLLDLGCGKVPFYLLYKDIVNDCYCVDWENTSHSNSFIDKMMDLNEDLDLSAESFDTVILSDVLEHIKSPEKLISEIYRVLSKDGYLLMNVPFMYWIHEEPHDYMRYTRYKLTEMAHENNFEVILLKEIGGGLEVITDISSKIFFSRSRLGRYWSYLIMRLSQLLLKTSFGKKLSESTKSHFPYGYFLVLKK